MESQTFFAGSVRQLYNEMLYSELVAMSRYEVLAQHFLMDHDSLFAFSAFYLELSGIHRQRAARMVAYAQAMNWPFNLEHDFDSPPIRQWISPAEAMDDAMRIEQRVRTESASYSFTFTSVHE